MTPRFMEEYYEQVGDSWKCRGVIPMTESGGRKLCWEGREEKTITSPVVLQRCFRSVVLKASPNKPVTVRTMLIPLNQI